MQELLIPLGRSEWYSLNSRIHHMDRYQRGKAIRLKTRLAARSLQPVDGPVAVTAYIAYPRGGRADPSNSASVVKHILDGLTDAGIWPDDDSTHLPSVAYRRDASTRRTGLWQVRLAIEPTT